VTGAVPADTAATLIRNVTTMLVPSPGRLRRSSRPPSISARSRMPFEPQRLDIDLRRVEAQAIWSQHSQCKLHTRDTVEQGSSTKIAPPADRRGFVDERGLTDERS
jgi:hypothetical protein